MKVAYLILFRFDENNGKYARLNDIFDSIERNRPEYDFRIFPLISDERELQLAPIGLNAEDVWGSRWYNLEAVLSASGVLNRILDYDPDVLHIGTSRRVESVLARIISGKLEIPVVIGPNIGGWYPVRPSEFWSGGILNSVSNRLNQITNYATLQLNSPDRVLAFSEYHKLMIRSLWNQNDRIEILHPAVSNRFQPNESVSRTTDILYVGDISEQKGYYALNEGLKNLDGDISITVDIVGGKPDTHPTFETIEVSYHGFVQRQNLPAYYNRAKLFVCLSSDEMGPNTLVEALACGTPALVHDEVGIREYLQNGNGICCNRNETADVVDSLKTCIDNQEQLLQRASAESASYSISQAITQLHGIYQEVTTGR